MRGRRPTADRSQLSERSNQPSRTPQPMLVAGRPDLEEMREPPDHLPEKAKYFWRESVVTLIEVGIVDRVDRVALEMMATQYAMWRTSTEVVKEEGYFALGSTGQMVVHPALKILNDATSSWMKMAEHFAMTPLARTRLGLAELHARTMKAEMEESLGGPTPMGADTEGYAEDITDLDPGGLTDSVPPVAHSDVSD